MAQALALVKRELGSDAVVLHTRSYRRGGVMGIGSRTVVEVTAGKGSEVGRARRRTVTPSRATALPKRRPAIAQADPKQHAAAGDLIRKEFLQTMLTARFVPGTRIPTYVAAGFFKADYPRYVLTLVFTAALYVGIVFSLFHILGAIAGEKAKFWLPIGAVVLLVCYIIFRWLNHVAKHEGPMTPLTKEFDHPMPDMPGFEGNPYETENEQSAEATMNEPAAAPANEPGPVSSERSDDEQTINEPPDQRAGGGRL